MGSLKWDGGGMINRILHVDGYKSHNQFYQDEAVHENMERPPVSYTITYTDASSGRDCGSATIPTSSCLNGTCCHSFGEISPPCSSDGDISISVFSTSILGDGPPSKPLIFSLKLSLEMNLVSLFYVSLCS